MIERATETENQGNRISSVWPVILAGGDGVRLRPLIRQWLGVRKPKQYCTFVGTRSMFQHTVDRADQIADPGNRITLIAREHWREAQSQLRGRKPGRMIRQPFNRETAAAIFLALCHVQVQDPDGIVVVFPSDHFVYPEDRFLEVVRRAIEATQRLKGRLVLLAVPPDRLELDYGWLRPGAVLGRIAGHTVRVVDHFLEKPSLETGRSLFDSGALWNTLVFASGVNALWECGLRVSAEMMTLFKKYSMAIGTRREEAVLDEVFARIPAWNFSTGLIEPLASEMAVIQLKDTIWSDWGRAERIAETLKQIGKPFKFGMSQTAGI